MGLQLPFKLIRDCHTEVDELAACSTNVVQLPQNTGRFLPVQRYASALLAVIACYLSVRPSVRPSQAGIVSKRLNTDLQNSAIR